LLLLHVIILISLSVAHPSVKLLFLQNMVPSLFANTKFTHGRPFSIFFPALLSFSFSLCERGHVALQLTLSRCVQLRQVVIKDRVVSSRRPTTATLHRMAPGPARTHRYILMHMMNESERVRLTAAV
jgi:hypothetical protein